MTRDRRDLRIVSLVPPATEILFELGRGDSVVGVSHECDYPVEAAQRPRVTHSRIEDRGSSADIDRQVREAGPGEPLYSIDEELLVALEPDLLVTQETCQVCAVSSDEVARAAEALPRPPRIVSLAGDSIEGVLADIVRVAEATGDVAAARRLVASLEARLERVSRITSRLEPGPTVAAIEWLDPLMASGHWVPRMIRLAGGRPVPDLPEGPSREIDWKTIRDADPDFLIVAPCGFSVGRALEEIEVLTRRCGYEHMRAPRSGHVYVADANAYFTRPGPRLVDGVEILAQLLHPRIFPGLIQVTENEFYALQRVA